MALPSVGLKSVEIVLHFGLSCRFLMLECVLGKRCIMHMMTTRMLKITRLKPQYRCFKAVCASVYLEFNYVVWKGAQVQNVMGNFENGFSMLFLLF